MHTAARIVVLVERTLRSGGMDSSFWRTGPSFWRNGLFVLAERALRSGGTGSSFWRNGLSVLAERALRSGRTGSSFWHNGLFVLAERTPRSARTGSSFGLERTSRSGKNGVPVRARTDFPSGPERSPFGPERLVKKVLRADGSPALFV